MKQLIFLLTLVVLATASLASSSPIPPEPNTQNCYEDPTVCPSGTTCGGRQDGFDNDGCCIAGYSFDWKLQACVAENNVSIPTLGQLIEQRELNSTYADPSKYSYYKYSDPSVDCSIGSYPGCPNVFCPHPSNEMCDGIDNDCDGVVDDIEGCKAVCGACGEGLFNFCDKQECQSLGFCSFESGIPNSCTSIGSVCVDEVCNGIDDDCDGEIDEVCSLELEQEDISGTNMLLITTSPHDAHIFVDNALACEKDSSDKSNSLLGTCVIWNISKGEHYVKATHPDYADKGIYIDVTKTRSVFLELSKACEGGCGFGKVCSAATKTCEKKARCDILDINNRDYDDPYTHNILFVGAGYNLFDGWEKELKKLIDRNGRSGLNGLFSVDPFRSNYHLFNFFEIREPHFQHTPTQEEWLGYETQDPQNLASYYAEQCKAIAIPIKNTIIVSQDAYYRSYAQKGEAAYVSLARRENQFKGRLLLHEFGHSFAGLKDEYVDRSNNPYGTPNCAPNIETAKQWWGDISDPEVGYFKGCANRETNIRPTSNSIMRNYQILTDDYGPVNEQAILEILDAKSKPNEREPFSLETPIIFVHGWNARPDTFDDLQEKLEEDGIAKNGKHYLWQVDSPSDLSIGTTKRTAISLSVEYYKDGAQGLAAFESENAGIEEYGDRLNDMIEEIREATGAEKVIIIAHSMGGLVSRSYIHQHGTDDVKRLITLATPHYGALPYTLPADILGDTSNYVQNKLFGDGSKEFRIVQEAVISTKGEGKRDTVQMTTGSDFLRDLNRQNCDHRKFMVTIGAYNAFDWFASKVKGSNFNRIKDDIKELDGCLADGKLYDGVVAEQSAKLRGADIYSVQCSHIDSTIFREGFNSPAIYDPNECTKAYEYIQYYVTN